MNRAIKEDFISKSRNAGFLGLEGHKWLKDSLRATTYNALSLESAQETAAFMKEY